MSFVTSSSLIADAHLIAAAPDLREAASDALAILVTANRGDTLLSEAEWGQLVGDGIAKLTAALAKADGASS